VSLNGGVRSEDMPDGMGERNFQVFLKILIGGKK
jgi:hypothetical protein